MPPSLCILKSTGHVTCYDLWRNNITCIFLIYFFIFKFYFQLSPALFTNQFQNTRNRKNNSCFLHYSSYLKIDVAWTMISFDWILCSTNCPLGICGQSFHGSRHLNSRMWFIGVALMLVANILLTCIMSHLVPILIQINEIFSTYFKYDFLSINKVFRQWSYMWKKIS